LGADHARVDGFMEKPLSPPKLRAAVDAILARSA